MTHHYINVDINQVLDRTARGDTMGGDFPLHHLSIEPDTPSENAPAIVLVHGRGSHEQDLPPLVEDFPDDIHVLSVRAPTPLGPGYTWYDLDLSAGGLHGSQPDPDGYDTSLTLLKDFVEEAIPAYDLDADRIGLIGFSQGAIMGLGAIVEYPDLFRWVAALHGYLPARYTDDELTAATGTPVFIGAGERDQIIPVTRAENAADRLRAAGGDVTFRTYPVGHGTNPQEVADLTAWFQTQIRSEPV